MAVAKLTDKEQTYYAARGGAVCLSCGCAVKPYGVTPGGVCLCAPCLASAAQDHQKHKRALASLT